MADPIELNSFGEPDSRFVRSFTHDYTGGELPSWIETVGNVEGSSAQPTFTRTWDGTSRSLMRIGVPDSSVTRQAGLRTPAFNARNNRLIRIRAEYRVSTPATSGSRLISQQLFADGGSGFQFGKLSADTSRAYIYTTNSSNRGFLRTPDPYQAGAGIYFDQSLWIDVQARTLWTGNGDQPTGRATLSSAYFNIESSIARASFVCTGVGSHSGVSIDLYRFTTTVWDDAR